MAEIREHFKVPAYNRAIIRTREGDVGVIYGADGVKLKVYFEGKNEKQLLNPNEVVYLGFTIKEKTDSD